MHNDIINKHHQKLVSVEADDHEIQDESKGPAEQTYDYKKAKKHTYGQDYLHSGGGHR